MLGFDEIQARRHIEILRGDANGNAHFKMFNDGAETKTPVSFYSNLNDATPSINHYTLQGYGIFVCVNPTDGEAAHAHNVTSYDFALADLDGVALPDNLPLKPILITARDATHSHVYWPISGCLTARDYNYVQRKIALWFDSDEQTIDPSRVLRLAGTWNNKDRDNPVQYKIIADNASGMDYEYTIDEVLAAFTLPADKQARLDEWANNRVARTSGAGFNDVDIYRQQLISFARDNAEPARKGDGRSYQLITVAGYGYDRGVKLEEVQQILWDYYNPRCEPPWCESERKKFNQYIANGFQYYNNAPGCKTASASFASMPAAEPVGGWENNAKLKKDKDKAEPVTPYVQADSEDLGHVTPTEAAMLLADINSKSKAFLLARYFLGECYPNKTLISREGMFYKYNGMHWTEVDSSFIEHQLYHLYSCWEPAPSKITNIVKTIGGLTLVDKLERGQYISTRQRANCVVMQNGIVEIDMAGKVVLKPHTQDLFELNALTYDYDPNAVSAEFISFINSQWPGDHQMHMQLQELYGLMLINESRFQVFPILAGKSRSGKGTHINVIRKMIGDHNICGPSLESLTKDYTLHTMSSKKVALIPEANDVHPAIRGQVLDRIKTITGGDPIEYDRKYASSATCSSWPLMVASCNEMPNYADSSGALANRVWPFPFTTSFHGREDRFLTDRLTTEESISGVFTWALQGAARLMKNGKVTMSKQAKEFVDEVRHDTFPLSDFIEEFCVIDGKASISCNELYDTYLLYCKAKAIKTPYTTTKFGKLLKASWLPVHKTRSSAQDRHQIFTGITISQEVMDRYKPKFTEVPNVVKMRK